MLTTPLGYYTILGLRYKENFNKIKARTFLYHLKGKTVIIVLGEIFASSFLSVGMIHTEILDSVSVLLQTFPQPEHIGFRSAVRV